MKEFLCLALICALLNGSLTQSVSLGNGSTTTPPPTTTKPTTVEPTTTTNKTTTVTTTETPTTTSHLTTSSPHPAKGTYVFKQCLALVAAIQINAKPVSENVPVNANTTGYCGKEHSNLTISWKEMKNAITFHFVNRGNTVWLENVDITLSNHSAKQNVSKKLSADTDFYSCEKTVLPVGNDNVTLGSLKVQAFNYNNTFSDHGEDCAAKTTVSPTTITHSPSTTPKPTPPSLATDKYVINGSVNGSHVSCLVMKAAISFRIPYQGKTKNHTHEGNIGSSPSYQGNCTNITNTLQIISGAVTLEFVFKKADKQYSLELLNLIANTKHFKDGNDTKIVANYNNTETFQLKLGDSYSCKSKTTLHLSSNVDVVITNLNLEAFRKSNTTVIDGKMVICPADQKTNSIVPIAVGAALAGLVVVVLIAYLIGRKRSRRGYESV